MSRRVALVGMMGAGKSTAGPLLAVRLGVPFFDLDRRIAEECGRSVTAIIRDDGEERFREREASLLAELLRRPAGVIAAGGGAVLGEENRRALRDWGRVVYLRAAPETLAARLTLAGITERPLLDGGAPLEALRKILETRAPLYEEADRIIDTDRLTPEETAAAVLRELNGDGHLLPDNG
ncbi:MAG: shikimate kinase [Candidatus Eisenbacteria bacterium]|nr:shikimate kinase [Candidatus Eisenbacteria bacterium]